MKVKILLFCIDGASWNVINPLLEEGQLPNLASLISKGTKGYLDNLDIAESPIIWTSIATGMPPARHGIDSFTTWMFRRGKNTLVQSRLLDKLPVKAKRILMKLRIVERVSVRSSMRKCRSIWNLLSESGGSVGVVNWWVTYPAEKVNGFLISDHANFFRLKLRRDLGAITLPEETIRNLPGVAYPDDILTDVFAYSELKDEVLLERVERFASLTSSDKTRFPTISTFERGDPLSVLKFSICLDEFAKHSCFISLSNMEKQPDFLSVYFSGVDGISHYFWKFIHPEDFSKIEDEEMNKFNRVINEYYKYMDEMLGDFLEKMTKDTLVIVVSDHGFESVKPEGSQGANTGTHTSAPNGILVMSGPNIKNNVTVNGKITDLVPTMLYLFGLPIGKDMEGTIIRDAIEEPYLKSHTAEYIDSWEGEHKAVRLHEVSDAEAKFKERLKALGYID
jgi:predicted AlkP superfamily phosphohydrolase/phosphomutase